MPGRPFARQGLFPTDNPRRLALALSLLEQRTAEKFQADDDDDSGPVGAWQAYVNPQIEFGAVGNGTLIGQWRRIGSQGVQIQLLLVVGATTAFGFFGIGFTPPLPPGYALDTADMLDGANSFRYATELRVSGLIGGANTGFLGTVTALNGKPLLAANALGGAAAGDRLNFNFELPVRAV